MTCIPKILFLVLFLSFQFSLQVSGAAALSNITEEEAVRVLKPIVTAANAKQFSPLHDEMVNDTCCSGCCTKVGFYGVLSKGAKGVAAVCAFVGGGLQSSENANYRYYAQALAYVGGVLGTLDLVWFTPSLNAAIEAPKAVTKFLEDTTREFYSGLNEAGKQMLVKVAEDLLVRRSKEPF